MILKRCLLICVCLKGHDLARVIKTAPKKPKTAQKTSNKKTGGPAGSAGVRGEGKGGGGKGGGGGVKVVTDAAGEKGDVKTISIAVAVALLAVFVAKVVAGFVFN